MFAGRKNGLPRWVTALAAALGCAALEPGSTPDELRAALEQLAEDSDALLIQHYAP